MKNKSSIIIIENQIRDFSFKKSKSNLNINFNRISFIFFIFFVISLIYSIHLIHLGSRKENSKIINDGKQLSNKLYRADIVDRNKKYIVKTIDSIDVGISPQKIINERKLLLDFIRSCRRNFNLFRR